MNILPLAHTTALSLALGGLLTLGATSEVNAANYTNTNGTGICRATSSAGAASFYYNHTYIWNSSASNQYLTCVVTNRREPTSTATQGGYMFWTAGGTGGTLTCTAQMGSYYFGTNTISSGSTQSVTLAAGASGTITFPSLARTASWETVNIICNVPPSFKLGLIQNIEAT